MQQMDFTKIELQLANRKVKVCDFFSWTTLVSIRSLSLIFFCLIFLFTRKRKTSWNCSVHSRYYKTQLIINKWFN